MSEALLQSRVVDLLRIYGWYVLEIDRAGMRRTKRRGAFEVGFPDLLALKGREFLLIELKTESGVVREKQHALHARLKRIGIEVAVCRTEQDVVALILSRGRP